MMIDRRAIAIAVAALALTAAAEVWAKDANSFAALQVPAGFPDITPEQKSLTSVRFAPGAPAVVLLEVEQQSQDPDFAVAQVVHIERIRRIKILTQAGIESYSDYRRVLLGDWRVQKLQARTVLPDGTIVDAKDSIFQEKSAGSQKDDSTLRTIRVAFPKVQVGAILDVRESYNVDGAPYRRWAVQDRIPVIENRFLMVIPDGLQMKIGAFLLSPDEQKAITGRTPLGRFFAWRFLDQTAVPDEPNQPPIEDISKALVIYPESFKTEAIYAGFSPDWKTWGKHGKERWDAFLKRKSEQVAELARQVCDGKSGAADKAEAIRSTIRTRFRIVYPSYWPPEEASPDELLTRGSGYSGDAAGLEIAMLKSVGVPAVPVVYRKRSSGILPKDTPLANLLDDTLVRIAGDKGPAYVSVLEDVPTGVPPPEARGVWAMAVDGASDAPALLPDYTAAENRASRIVRAQLSADGSLSGEIEAQLRGVRADRWRSLLDGRSSDEQKSWIQDQLRSAARGLVLQTVEVSTAADGSRDLLVKAAFRADGYATPAGKRLMVNANLLSRMPASEWSAEERTTAVELGGAYENNDTVFMTLPPEAADALMPSPPASYDAGNVGSFTSSYERRDRVVVLNRVMRLSVYRFPPTAYGGLRHWFGDIAAMDDRPVVVTLK
jgi:hypothetical protein